MLMPMETGLKKKIKRKNPTNIFNLKRIENCPIGPLTFPKFLNFGKVESCQIWQLSFWALIKTSTIHN